MTWGWQTGLPSWPLHIRWPLRPTWLWDPGIAHTPSVPQYQDAECRETRAQPPLESQDGAQILTRLLLVWASPFPSLRFTFLFYKQVQEKRGPHLGAVGENRRRECMMYMTY